MEVEKIFVNWLSPAICSIVSRFSPEQGRNILTFDCVLLYEMDEGDSYRALMPTCNQSFGSANRTAVNLDTRMIIALFVTVTVW